MIRAIPFLVVMILLPNQTVLGQIDPSTQAAVEQSRQNAVRIFVPEKQAWGSGFFLDDRFVVTCFHVIGGIDSSGAEPEIRPADDIRVICPDGQEIIAECRSIPSRLDMSPILYDFAVLWLHSKPDAPVIPARFAPTRKALPIGTEVFFSAYPTDVPLLMTHRGHISGDAGGGGILSVQAPFRDGMSGAALYALDGSIVGVVNARESPLSQGLLELARTLYATKPGEESAQEAHLLELIEILDRYTTQGITYANGARFLAEYLERHPRDEP